ncbi:hypothetical protein C1646_673432, partial [Rhizophagus diaphanus]
MRKLSQDQVFIIGFSSFTIKYIIILLRKIKTFCELKCCEFLMKNKLKVDKSKILYDVTKEERRSYRKINGEFTLREKYHLLLYLEADIIMIQAYLDIVGYTNEETIKEDVEKDHEVFVKNSAGTDQCPCLEQDGLGLGFQNDLDGLNFE